MDQYGWFSYVLTRLIQCMLTCMRWARHYERMQPRQPPTIHSPPVPRIFNSNPIMPYSLSTLVCSHSKPLSFASLAGRLEFLNFSGDITTRVDTLSAWTGQFFISLSILGCQQNLVQRYLSMKSVNEVRRYVLCYTQILVHTQFFYLLC